MPAATATPPLRVAHARRDATIRRAPALLNIQRCCLRRVAFFCHHAAVASQHAVAARFDDARCATLDAEMLPRFECARVILRAHVA